MMVQQKITDSRNKYFDALSRGRLTVPLSELLEFVCTSLAILDFADTLLKKKTSVRKLIEICLGMNAPKSIFAVKQ